MIDFQIFDDRYRPEPREPRGFFPPYCKTRREKLRYLDRREVHFMKDPFLTELDLYFTGDNLCD